MEQFDIVIVGAGIAGALVADVLAQKKYRVLVLDAGPEEQNRGQLLLRYYADPSKHSDSPYPASPHAPQPIAGSPNEYFDNIGKDTFSASYVRRVGGTTWHWEGLTPRLLPTDFSLQTSYGVGIDWPIRYDELEPWYVAAEREMNVAGDNNVDYGSPRSAEFPHPPLAQAPIDVIINNAMKGITFRDKPIQTVSQSTARHPGICQGSGSCTPICPTAAKYEAISHINRARQNGAVIRSQSVVTNIVVGDNERISHVIYKTWDSVEYEVTGKRFVLAANGIEIPKLLLLAAQANQRPVANSSDQVGRNLMDHPAYMSMAAANEPIGAYLGPQVISAITTTQDGEFRKREAAFLTYINNSGFDYWSGPTTHTRELIFDQGLTGQALQNTVADHAPSQFFLFSQCEQLPDPLNRVMLSDKLDSSGIPRAKISLNYSSYSTSARDSIKKMHTMIFEKVGVRFTSYVYGPVGADHIMGTTRMGTNPKTSVVDADLKCHDHDNLYITSSSVFPTSGTSNPTLTIAALSLRLADHLAQELNESSS